MMLSTKATQKFGQANPQEKQQWRDDLKKGDASALKKEMEAVKEQMQKLASQPDSAEKASATGATRPTHQPNVGGLKANGVISSTAGGLAAGDGTARHV
jgi:uncharacterized protein with von Willebrand factor type A (vWA) domain